MNRFAAGVVAVLVGGALAFATALGIVTLMNETPNEPQATVMDYGTTNDQ